MQYLDNPRGKHDRKIRVYATNYVSYQNELYRKGEDGLLLLCLGPQEAAKQSQRYMKEFAKPVNQDARCVGCFTGMVTSGQAY
ncbi:hypothetical protein ACFX13_006975 [Malus domestica]